VRLQPAGQEKRDKAAEMLRQKYAVNITMQQDRIPRAGQQMVKQQAEARSS
jgi:hypothetical protein